MQMTDDERSASPRPGVEADKDGRKPTEFRTDKREGTNSETTVAPQHDRVMRFFGTPTFGTVDDSDFESGFYRGCRPGIKR